LSPGIKKQAETDGQESTTARIAGDLDFTAIGGKRQGDEVPQSLRVKPWMLVQSPAVAGFGKPN
jgi:hypothetical protein